MPRETATERRARDAIEARVKQEKWEQEKPMRLLNALARAHDLGIKAYVTHRYIVDLYYVFHFDDDIFENHDNLVCALAEWTMDSIEASLDEIQKRRDRESYLLALRAELLSTMTDEEREALGLS
jgi:hypothetical protein